MKKKYISNSSESSRMFKNNFLEAMSKVNFYIPLFIYLPVIFYFSFIAFARGIQAGSYVLYLLFGIFVWSVTEYLLHRFIFHFEPTSKSGKRLHFIFHGVHHDFPRDRKRLVMPPTASVPLSILFYFLFSLFFENSLKLYSFYSGFIMGYLIYDMMHYAIHHHNFKNPVLKKIKQHHMLHHYSDPTKGYGVSSALWDIIFQSGFRAKN
jgi:sterol desaturase/sphingolipid hydroxylase (fatty acid hydroxylase superfamily)